MYIASKFVLNDGKNFNRTRIYIHIYDDFRVHFLLLKLKVRVNEIQRRNISFFSMFFICKEFRHVFELFDKNGDGSIDANEIGLVNFY